MEHFSRPVNFQKLFESLPGRYIAIAPDFTILAVSDVYLKTSQTTPAIIGKNLFEVFPDNPDDLNANGVSTLRASLQKVFDTGKPDAMPTLRYDIRIGDEFAERWWTPTNTPVFDDSGKVMAVNHIVEEATEHVRLKKLQSDAKLATQKSAVQSLEGGGEVGAMMRAMNWSQNELGPVESWPQSLKTAISIMLDTEFPMAIYWGPNYIHFYNDAFRPILGTAKHPGALGRPAAEVYPEGWAQVDPLFAQVMQGHPYFHEDLLLPLDRHGFIEDRYFTFCYSPIRDESGSVGGILSTLIETTDRINSEREIAKSRAEAVASSNQLRTITDRLPAFVSYMDMDGRYRFINEAYSRWFGKPASEIEGKTRRELVGNDATFEVMSPYQQRAFAGEASEAFELTLTKPNGESVNLDTEYIPDRDPVSGVVRGIIGVGHDVTLRKKALQEAENTREELRGIFTQAQFPMAILSGPEHTFTLANPFYVKLAGREVLGKTLREVFKPSEVDFYIPILDKVYRTGEPVFLHEAPVTLPDEQGIVQERSIDVGYHPYRDRNGITAGVLVVIIEVTESVQARKRVEALASELSDAVNARDEFMSIASHELKTPITSLRLQLQLTQRRIKPELGQVPTPEKLKTVMETSMRQVDRLTDLIETLLDITRIQAGRLEYNFSRFDIQELLTDVSDHFGHQLEMAGNSLTITSEPSLSVVWDRFRIEQVLVNLLSNAAKYAPGKPVTVHIRKIPDGQIEIRVHDSGPGIPAEQQPKIFERFERANASRNISGLGLGLFIAKQVVSGHHGSIRVDSSPETGTTFILEIPVQAGAE